MPRVIVNLAKRYQTEALRIEVSAGARGHADIEYRALRIAPQDSVHAIVNVLRMVDSPAALVFCNTRDGVRHLHGALVERGFSAVSLSGEFSQTERNHALQALRDGRARVCVATDVAARGIDLPNLGLVVHADLPNDAETLQHRSGRTGRAGRKGVSMLIIPPAHRRKAERLLASARIEAVWTTPPTADDIRALDNERLLQSLLTAESDENGDLTMAKALLAKRSPESIAAALVRMYRAQLPAPEDLVDLGGGAPNPSVRPEHPPARGPNTGLSNSVWFRLNVGRQRKADPKWLIPEICRQGGITKREIGAIRIFDQETKFEIDAAVAEEFATRIAKVTKGDIHIGPSDAPADGGHVRRSPAPNPGKRDWKHKSHAGQGRPREDRGEPRDKPRWSAKAKHEGRPKFGGKRDGKPGGEFAKSAKTAKRSG